MYPNVAMNLAGTQAVVTWTSADIKDGSGGTGFGIAARQILNLNDLAGGIGVANAGIPTGAATVYPIAVGQGGTVTNVTVNLNFIPTDTTGLKVMLYAPNGTEITLIDGLSVAPGQTLNFSLSDGGASWSLGPPISPAQRRHCSRSCRSRRSTTTTWPAPGSW